MYIKTPPFVCTCCTSQG